MPIKKRVETESTAAAAEPKTAKRATKKTTAEPKAATARKPAAKPATLSVTAAATHKATARRTATKTVVAPAFDVDVHREEVEREAYLIWAGRGHEHGQAHEDWLRAIELVKARHQN
ncbi:MAG: DUF2934 domain-containing protein [Bryobacteraceae bacterium]|nr:DUF2934 domain-containing protein [Bryobacteraceae bacterium]